MDCYYKLLEVPVNASYEEIKKSFRRMALKWHPDVSKHPLAKERFQEIVEAYETLIDPVKREQYNRLKGYPSPGNGGNKRTVKSASLEFVNYYESVIRENLYHYFGIIWNESPFRKNRDLRFDIYLKDSQVEKGWTEEISYVRLVYCFKCKANARKYRDCEICYGRGFIEESKTLKVHIPPGCAKEYRLYYPGAGDHLQPESSPGGLFVYVHVIS